MSEKSTIKSPCRTALISALVIVCSCQSKKDANVHLLEELTQNYLTQLQNPPPRFQPESDPLPAIIDELSDRYASPEEWNKKASAHEVVKSFVQLNGLISDFPQEYQDQAIGGWEFYAKTIYYEFEPNNIRLLVYFDDEKAVSFWWFPKPAKK